MNSPIPESKSRPEILLLEYLDDTIDDAGMEELNACLLRDPALRRFAAQLLIQQVHLRELAREEPDLLRDIIGKRSSGCSVGLRRLWNLIRDQWHWISVAGAATALLLLLLGYYARFGTMLRVETVHGDINVRRAEREWKVTTGIKLLPGDRLALQTGASAVVHYSGEATELRLSDSAVLTLGSTNRSKLISLEVGTLAATVARQPRGAPMHLVTPQATATILGTELLLTSHSGTTRLDVTEGKVEVVRIADGASALSEKGTFVVIREGGPLVSEVLVHGLLREYWLQAKAPPGTELVDLPCLSAKPSGSELLSDFEAPTSWGDTYVTRIRGYLQVPITGQHRFWIAGDDRAELWLSADEDPAHKQRVCWTSSWTAPRDWDKSGSQRSPLILLKAGRRYYLEALHQEVAGSDSLAVAWLAPTRTREVLPGAFLNPLPVSDDQLGGK